MSRWHIAVGIWMLTAALAVAQTPASSDAKSAESVSSQDSPSPYGLPPPFKPPPEAKPAKPAPEAPINKAEMPPEEDKSNAPPVFSFNPIQSKREVEVGTEYFKKGNYTAAISRYDEATKWNDGNAEAWKLLGEAQEKKSNARAAREAYRKYLELAPDAKDVKEIKNRLARLNH